MHYSGMLLFNPRLFDQCDLGAASFRYTFPYSLLDFWEFAHKVSPFFHWINIFQKAITRQRVKKIVNMVLFLSTYNM